MKTIAIMQPYFFPYIGYFQLIAAVDIFVLYDNIKYTKKGWINRNRILQNEKDAMFSLPLKSGSDSLDICQRELSVTFNHDKLLNQFKSAYCKAPNFHHVFPLIEQIVRYKDENLFTYLHQSILKICQHLGITTEIRVSSTMLIDHTLKGQEKVLALCKSIGVDTYINAIGGIGLYSKKEFREQGIDLKFIKSRPFEYVQLRNAFIPWLSIIDVMMFNKSDVIYDQISAQYDLV
jgi:hypothetical protein